MRRRRRPQPFKRLLIAVIAVLLLGPLSLQQMAKLDMANPMGINQFLMPDAHQAQKTEPAAETNRMPVISGARRVHILYGDNTGGGHLHGAGKPCKSEFPAHWPADKIIQTVERAAANDNLPWRQQDNGYHVSDIMAEDLRIRIVVNQDKTEVVTAYPLNVRRNPCPANDNKY